jgi:hypothetical protein
VQVGFLFAQQEMPRGVRTPPELRARAEALLLAGHSQAETCTLTGLPKASISAIARALDSKFEQVRTKNAHAREQSDTELILAYFRGVLEALTAQTEVFRDPVYCRAQDVDKLAVAHGILGDKLAGIATTAQTLGLIGPRAVHAGDTQPGARPALDEPRAHVVDAPA